MEAIHIVGAGGIGCAVGHALAGAGVPVVVVEADPAKVAWGRQHGLVMDRQAPRPVPFELFADWGPPADALVLLCTKCYDNAAVLARLPASCALLPIQNGFDPHLATHGHGAEGIASFVSECTPGRAHSRLTRPGCLHLGPRGPSRTAPREQLHLERLTAALRASRAFRVVAVPDVLPYKYTKLMYNAAISPLAAAAGLDNGDLLALPQARPLFFALLQENYAILRGAGVPLGRIGPFTPATVARVLRLRALARLLAVVFTPSLRGTYCSMSGDLPRGRTEIDYYNRHLIDLAADRPCPLNRQVYDLVKRMERERLGPGLQWLGALVA